MNSKKFSVLEDLFELSRTADNIIENTLAESAFHESFFEDTKKEIYRLLINKSPAKKKKSESKSCFFRPKRECIFEPFLEIRAHVHKKTFSKSLEESTNFMNSNEESMTCNKTEVSDISLFNKYEVKTQNNKIISSVNSWDESPHHLRLDSVRNTETTFDKYSTPNDSSVCKSTYRKPENVDSGNFHNISPISNEFNISPIQIEETIIISSDSDNRTSKNVTIDKTDIQSTVKCLSSERVDRGRKATSGICVNKVDTNVSDLNKTFTLSSNSNKKCIFSNDLSSSSELCCDCSALSFSAKKHCKKKESKSVLEDHGVSLKNYSSVISSGYVSGNPFEENTSEKSPLNLRTKKSEISLVNEKKSSITDEKELFIQYQNKTSDTENTSSENGRLSIIAVKEPHRCCKKAINTPSRKLLLTTLTENVSTFENQSSYSEEKKSSTSSQSLGCPSSDSDKSRSLESKTKDTDKVSIEHYKGKFKRKSIANKEQSAHFRALPAPINRKVTTSRNLRPKTPIDLVNSNHQSLKVKAEEKRKQREIRVQRTKERRERLEREREERMRDSEQKLKKRFQQHEEMLKQKTETFKIKSVIREPRYNKRSGASTSSKDSKEDRTKDNDDFCRNAVNSGQKLYKESNGNRDVTPGENDLVSLDGDVGSNPEVSPQVKAILKGCEQTPVEFPVYRNNAKTVDTISLKKSKKLQFQKDSNSEQVPNHTRPIVLKLLKNYNKENMLSNSQENESPKRVEKKENFELPDKVKCISPCSERSKNIDKASKELSKSCNSKNSQNTYLLRSAVKRKARKINDTTDSVNKGINSKCENLGDKKVNTKEHRNIRKSSEKEKMCTNLCFKINKNKPKKVIKVPRKHNIYETNAFKSFAKPTRCKRYKLYDSSKESEKAGKLPNKTQEIISYDIPEEVGDSSEDSIDDPAKIPLWATGVYLKQALLQQLYFPPNVEDIFGVLRKEPVNLTALFGEDKPTYHHRTSSERWSLHETPK